MTAKTTLPELIGSDLDVPLATGGSVRYTNLDYAASTPAMRLVADTVADALPWYSSVHRGAGHTSQVSTRLYEAARHAVHEFAGARDSDVVIFVRHTTEAVNLLATALKLKPGDVVLSTAVEHHANMLPWRRLAPVVHLQPPPSPEALLQAVAAALTEHQVGVIAITGASNVTGEVFPIQEVAALGHQHGALVCVDGAQLAPHRNIDMAAMGIDCLAFSGHKMYAPFGSGALVAPAARLRDSEPMLAGGGAVDFVTLADVVWTGLPDRLEAGSPNVLGAIALGAACTALQRVGFDAIAAHERELLQRLDDHLDGMPHIRRLRLWEGGDRLGVSTFTVDGMHHAHVAAALSAEWGIGVRHGCFCAHPYITHLLGIEEAEADEVRSHLRRGERRNIPGAVRASFGIGTTIEDVDRLAEAITALVTTGPTLEYTQDSATGDFAPTVDRRTWPSFELLPSLDDYSHGGGCGQF